MSSKCKVNTVANEPSCIAREKHNHTAEGGEEKSFLSDFEKQYFDCIL